MSDLSSIASTHLSGAHQQLVTAESAAREAEQWCQRAGQLRWESPAAAVFSRWLAELAANASANAAQVADLRVRSPSA